MNGVVLDGEVVALDEAGRPSFQRLQQRGKLTRGLDIRQAAIENPVTYYAFDLLAAEGFDLRPLPLVVRKRLLRKLLPPAGAIRFLDHFEGDGELLYQQVQKLGLEGIVAKQADSTYRAGRSPCWLKIRTRLSDDFVVVGFTASKGLRTGFGALLLAQYVEGALVYSGRAGTGFSDKQLSEVRETLAASRRDGPPAADPSRRRKGLPGPSRGWFAKWSLPNGPRSGSCVNRSSCIFATIRSRRSVVRQPGTAGQRGSGAEKEADRDSTGRRTKRTLRGRPAGPRPAS